MANFPFGPNDYNVNIRAQQNVNFIPGWDAHRLALTFEVTALGNYTVDVALADSLIRPGQSPCAVIFVPSDAQAGAVL
ncbi:hypothetical protein [Streptomyces sp. NPDC097610]|uniref:hypothetical protein n=1 Tax=Streptomyces sp. NPDC097610 TaxID=3157227 RepID=UPI00332ACA72